MSATEPEEGGSSAESFQPLKGVRVIDFTRVLAGPSATQILADLGADVIKIERPGTGDDSRIFGPPFLSFDDGRETRATSMFLMCNRGKRSMTLNLQQPEGVAIARKLIADADVVVENFKVGTMERLGLGAQSLRAEFPGLIFCSITGFGQNGPLAERGGYDPVIQAMSGMMSVTGKPPGTPGAGPIKTGPSLVDMFAGLNAVIAITSALHQRSQTGEGAEIDIALLDSAIQIVAQHAQKYFLTGESPVAEGNTSNSGVPGGGYECADGHIVFAQGNEEGYRRICRAMDLPELLEDPRFRNNVERVKNKDALLEILLPELASRKVDELAEALVSEGVPVSRVNNMEEMLAEPQIAARGLAVDLPNDRGQNVKQIAGAMVVNGKRVIAAAPPPDLGADTHDILSELSFSEAEIGAMHEKGIV